MRRVNEGGFDFHLDDSVPADVPLAEVAKQLTGWANAVQGRGMSGSQSLMSATKANFRQPTGPFDTIGLLRRISQDDTVSGALDVLVGLAVERVKFESDNEDEADVYNQTAKDLDVDNLLRVLLRELILYSTVTTAVLWTTKTVRVRGRAAPTINDELLEQLDSHTVVDPKLLQGPRKRKSYTLRVPEKVIILDPACVIPVGSWNTGEGRLALSVTDTAMRSWQSNRTLSRICLGKYEPSDDEITELSSAEINTDCLLELDPKVVQRHTDVRADYEKWPAFRMASVAPLLEMKEQLRRADLVTLTSCASFIILVRKGTKDQPAEQDEIDNLTKSVNVLAKLPVVVGDHRLTIDIISADTANVLNGEKYDTIDKRIISRLMGIVSMPTSGQRNSSELTQSRLIARLLESRRHMIVRHLESLVFDPMQRLSEYSKQTDKLVDGATLAFYPAKVALDSESAFWSVLQAARASRDISRESYLERLGMSAETELSRMIREMTSGSDMIHKTATPFDSPQNNPLNQGIRGGEGGRPAESE